MQSAEAAYVRGLFENAETPSDLDGIRSGLDALAASLPASSSFEIERLELAGCKGEWITTSGAGSDGPIILFLHGGGYIAGSLDSHRHLAGAIANAAQGKALSLEYRLAPEHPYPAALEDALAGYKFLSVTADTSKVFLAGDSAGGGLVMSLLLSLRDLGMPMPAGAVLLSPWVDHDGRGASISSKSHLDPAISRAGGEMAERLYFAATEGKAPKPVLSDDLHGLPPLFIQVGSDEVLLDDSSQLAVKAAHAEISVTLQVWPKMIHVFQFFYAILPEARDAIGEIGAFIRRIAPVKSSNEV